jgi:hypothetical protein
MNPAHAGMLVHLGCVLEPPLAQLLDDLLDAIRDWFMGTPWKSDIPSHETIRSHLV